METAREQPRELPPLLWVGGSPCSGKSNIVETLCSRYGLANYHCDDHWDRHVRMADRSQQPLMYRQREMSWDEIWMRDVTAQVEDELAIYREEFPMIRDDLVRMPSEVQVIAEGAALLPELVAPLLSDVHQAIWIVPTEDFQRQVYRQRGPWVQQILSECTNPHVAWENWMARDAAFARRIAGQAVARNLRLIWVDGQRTVDQVRDAVETWLARYLSQ